MLAISHVLIVTVKPFIIIILHYIMISYVVYYNLSYYNLLSYYANLYKVTLSHSRPHVRSPLFQTPQHPAANALFPLTKNNETLTSMRRPGHLEVDLRRAFYL